VVAHGLARLACVQVWMFGVMRMARSRPVRHRKTAGHHAREGRGSCSI